MNDDVTSERELIDQAGYLFDPINHTVTDPDGITIELTPRQFRVALETMSDVYTTYPEITERVRALDDAEHDLGSLDSTEVDSSHAYFNGVTLRVTIYNIRKRFEKAGATDPIEDRVSFGYRAARK